MSKADSKEKLRQDLLKWRKNLEDSFVRQATAKIQTNCIKLLKELNPQSIHTYLPMPKFNEIDTWPIIRELEHSKIDIAVPLMRNNEIRSAKITSLTKFKKTGEGPPEPVNPTFMPDDNTFNVVLVPLIGFDKSGYRLGYGKGHYDKFLAGLTAIKIGLAYSEIEIESLPREPHDVPLDYIITEEKILKTN